MPLPDYQKKLLLDLTVIAIAQIGIFYGIKYALNRFDPQRQKKDEAKLKSKRIIDKLGLEALNMNEYEQVIAGEILWPEDIKVTFDDIGGLDGTLNNLQESVIYPLMYPEIFESVSGLLGPPKGVLLYGPPGCGKTMTAKALARESGATFINLHVSTMTDKWFGESQKLVHALFSLAKKLEPTIIFIDEIDSFLRERKSSDHEATSMMKAEFMTLWDGMNTGPLQRVVILGATNRPNDLDKAILRRMPKRFQISLPDRQQRKKVLEILLKNVPSALNIDLDKVVFLCEGYSNSDLKELCRNALMIPVREAIREAKELDSQAEIKKLRVRPIVLQDFLDCMDSLSHSLMTMSTVVPAEID